MHNTDVVKCLLLQILCNKYVHIIIWYIISTYGKKIDSNWQERETNLRSDVDDEIFTFKQILQIQHFYDLQLSQVKKARSYIVVKCFVQSSYIASHLPCSKLYNVHICHTFYRNLKNKIFLPSPPPAPSHTELPCTVEK